MASLIAKILNAALFICIFSGACNSQASCKEWKRQMKNAPSKVYSLRIASGKLLQVYCEMASNINGGAYTFLHPTDLLSLTDADIAPMFTDNSSFLLRVQRTDVLQSYAVLSQLPEYDEVALKISINNHAGYNEGPQNIAYIGTPYIFYGFLPRYISATTTIQGLRVNGVRAAYSRCDPTSASYFALFPNFDERTPFKVFHDGPIYRNIFDNVRVNPSRRVMPTDYFMFGEIHFGACGTYVQTDQMSRYGVVNIAIGFR